MRFESMLGGLIETALAQVRLPEGYEWAPLAISGTILLLGLLMMVRGARWARGMGAFAFLGVGAAVGAVLSTRLGTPAVPTAGVVGVVALVGSLIFFRLWQAMVLAACFALAGVGVYYAQSLTPHVESYFSRGLENDQWISLQPAGAVVATAGVSAPSELGSLYSHLAATVPQFQFNLFSILGATALAGLVFGWLLPRVSISLWAATQGTLALGIGAAGLLKLAAPSWLDMLVQNPQAGWGLLAIVWVGGFIYNLLATRRPKTRSAAEVDADEAPAPAPA